MSEPVDLSIIIVNWNGRKILRNCLQSIREHHDNLAIQTIVVDNASTDASADVVPADFPEMTLVRNDANRGFAAANNQGAAIATGRYLFFLNNDTVVPAGSLSRLAKYLDEHPEAVAVGPQLIGDDGVPQRSGRNLVTLRALLHQNVLPFRWTGLGRKSYRAYRHAFDATRSGPVPQLAGAALLVRREAFFACGQWDEQFQFGVEDVDLCLRLAALGTIYYLADATITHLGRVSSHMNRGWVFRGYQCGFVKYLRKHHRNRWAPLIYKIGVTIDTPIRLLPLWPKAAISRLRGNREGADKSASRAAALWFFLTHGLVSFWRA